MCWPVPYTTSCNRHLAWGGRGGVSLSPHWPQESHGNLGMAFLSAAISSTKHDHLYLPNTSWFYSTHPAFFCNISKHGISTTSSRCPRKKQTLLCAPCPQLWLCFLFILSVKYYFILVSVFPSRRSSGDPASALRAQEGRPLCLCDLQKPNSQPQIPTRADCCKASVFMSSGKPSVTLNLPFHRLLEGVGGSVTPVIQKCPQGYNLQPQHILSCQQPQGATVKLYPTAGAIIQQQCQLRKSS